jgi:hypothetical protein
VSGKLEFGFDYLYLMRNFEMRGLEPESKQPFNRVEDAAARLFLLQWGFSVEEIDAANKLFLDRLEHHALERDLKVVVDRLVEYVKTDPVAQERLVVQMAALGALDANVTKDEAEFVMLFQNLLDMRQSEFKRCLDQGADWAIALGYFGSVYAEERPKRK